MNAIRLREKYDLLLSASIFDTTQFVLICFFAGRLWRERDRIGGETLLCNNNSGIPDRILKRLLRVIEANSQKIITDWLTHFGEIRYYC